MHRNPHHKLLLHNLVKITHDHFLSDSRYSRIFTIYERMDLHGSQVNQLRDKCQSKCINRVRSSYVLFRFKMGMGDAIRQEFPAAEPFLDRLVQQQTRKKK